MMAIDLETLQATLRLQSDQWRAGMAKAKQDIAGLKTTLKDFGKRTSDIGRDLTTKITLPVAAGFGFAIKQASDLNEAQSAVSTVYGDAAKDIIGYNKGVAASTGLSREEALSASATLGVFGKQAGYTGKDLVKFNNQTVQAAADLASFYNTPVPDALAAIQSGLSGEVEPLRRFGIFLSDATIKQYAMTHGIGDGSGALTEQQKIMARSGYILDHLGDANGDYTRTNNQLANTLRTVQAQFKDVGAQFGDILLPLTLRLARASGQLLDRFAGFSSRTKTIILVIAGLAAALGPILLIVGQLAIAIGALAPVFAVLLGPIGLLIVALAGLTIAYQTNFLGFRDLVDNVLGSKALKRFLKSIAKIVDGFLDMGKALKKGDFSGAFDGLKKAAAGLGDFLAAPAKAVGEFIRGIQTGFRPLDLVFRELGNVIVGFGRLVQEVFQGDWRGALEVAKKLAEDFFQFLANLARLGWEALALGIEQVFGTRAADAFRAVGETIGQAVSFLTDTLLPGIITFAQGAWNWITGTAVPAIAAVWDTVTTYLSPFITWLADTGLPKITDFAQGAHDQIQKVVSKLKDIYDTIAQYLSPFLDWLFNTFQTDFVTWVGNIKNQIQSVIDKLTDIYNKTLGDDGALMKLYNWWKDTFIPAFSGWVQTIQTAGEDIRSALTDIWDVAKGPLTDLKDFWGDLESAISTFAGKVGGLVQPIIDAFNKIAGAIPDLPGWLGGDGGGKPTSGEPNTGTRQSLMSSGGGSPLARLVAAGLGAGGRTDSAAPTPPDFSVFTDAFKTAGADAALALQAGLTAALESVTKFSVSAANNLATFAMAAGQQGMDAGRLYRINLGAGLTDALNAIGLFVSFALSKLDGFARAAGDAGTNAGNAFNAGLGGGLAKALGTAESYAADIANRLSGVAASAYISGTNIGAGLRDGMNAMADDVAAAAANLAAAADHAANARLDTGSPSRVFRRIGQSIGTGLALGISDMDRRVSMAGNRLAAAAIGVPASSAIPLAMGTGARGVTINVGGLTVHSNASDSRAVAREVFRELDREFRLRGL